MRRVHVPTAGRQVPAPTPASDIPGPPGMVMASEALLRRTPEPSEAQIRDALAGNLCRCTGYVKIVEAVRAAARG